MKRSFRKMHGLGNDFVVIDSRADNFIPDAALCRRLADRNFGIGCDQIIIMAPPQNPAADLYMHIFNCDGSRVGACGNATRCVARLLFDETGKKHGVIETLAGLLKVNPSSDGVVDVVYPPPRLDWQGIPLAQTADTLNLNIGAGELVGPCCVNVGNPHAVFFVPNAEAVALATLGPQLEHHALFPERCNIEVAQILDRAHIRMRVWERGTGITKACGSGACATLIAAVRRGLSDRSATITLDGGDLKVTWRDDNYVVLTGGATLVYQGTLAEEFFAQETLAA